MPHAPAGSVPTGLSRHEGPERSRTDSLPTHKVRASAGPEFKPETASAAATAIGSDQMLKARINPLFPIEAASCG